MADVDLRELQAEKEAARQTLASAFADDLIDADELERRTESVELAIDLGTVRDALRGLDRPSSGPPAVPATNLPVPVTALAAEDRITTILSGAKRRGPWMPARKTYLRTVLGNLELDLRQMPLQAGEIELALFVCLGEVTIIVPPGVTVDLRCTTVLADTNQEAMPSESSAMRVVITGTVVLGSVLVDERLPGERARDAKKRRRAEQKALRERAKRALSAGRE